MFFSPSAQATLLNVAHSNSMNVSLGSDLAEKKGVAKVQGIIVQSNGHGPRFLLHPAAPAIYLARSGPVCGGCCRAVLHLLDARMGPFLAGRAWV